MGGLGHEQRPPLEGEKGEHSSKQSPSPLTVPQNVQPNDILASGGHYFGPQPMSSSSIFQHQISGFVNGPQPMPQNNVTHNLIPSHLQQTPATMQQQALVATSLALHGTPGHQPALIQPPLAAAAAAAAAATIPRPILTVQDQPMVPPLYNGVNPDYPGVRLLHANPPVFSVDNFLTPQECDFLIHAACDSMSPAPVVGKGSGEISASRTSSTCYLARQDLPNLMRKVSLLTGKPIEHCELPQVGRYLPSQQYLQHFDAFDLTNEDGVRFASNGGQRTVTVLVYLNDVMQGGQTSFPALPQMPDVQPRRGMALVFFPATVDGLLDKMALHAALPAVDVKYVSQVWIRQGVYQGQPSKRLSQTMGVPFGGGSIGSHTAEAAAAAVTNGFVSNSNNEDSNMSF